MYVHVYVLVFLLQWRRNDLYFGGAHSIHVQFMCSIIAYLVHDQANIGGAIAPPAPMVPTPMFYVDNVQRILSF